MTIIENEHTLPGATDDADDQDGHEGGAPDHRTQDKGADGDDDAEIEARARRMGWVPEGEWDDDRSEKEGKRKPTRFKTARQYVEDSENSLPMLRSQLRSMDAKLNESQRQTAEIYDVMQEQKKLHRDGIERARKEEREKIEREREEAVAEGDVTAFRAADAKLKEHDKLPTQQERQEDPDITAFKAANAKWFTVDARLTNNMIDEFGEVKQEMPHLSMREQLAEAKKRVENRFPEKFGRNPRRESARSGVTPPTGGREGGNVDRRFAGLSDAEQAVYHRSAKIVEARGGKMSKAEWLEEIGR